LLKNQGKTKGRAVAWWLGFCPECDQIERGKETFSPSSPNTSYFLFLPDKNLLGGNGGGRYRGECTFYLLLLKSLDWHKALAFRLRRVRMIHIPGIHIKDKTKVTSNDFPLGVVFFFGLNYVQFSSP
jgi:hypothetical protein